MDPGRMFMFLVMAYMEYEDLRVYIHQHGVSLSSAKSIAIQTLEGLEVMYSKHIYHRDIKPQVVACLNPILVKITDFGVSKQALGTFLTTRCGTAP
ncbi:kinase-like protein [Morchella conica CCBAS932]|uniref:Autophagy-related protein 1 n=1 Tax=Morchella conica CCBAS932 TaxID=1392247 RepID=A0A3N4K777_9PEZI|nr:kinase-like protein [Morchella conica CCBAS932]